MISPFKSDDTDKEAQRETPTPSHDDQDDAVPRTSPPPKDTTQKHESQNIHGDQICFVLTDEEARAGIGPFGAF